MSERNKTEEKRRRRAERNIGWVVLGMYGEAARVWMLVNGHFPAYNRAYR